MKIQVTHQNYLYFGFSIEIETHMKHKVQIGLLSSFIARPKEWQSHFISKTPLDQNHQKSIRNLVCFMSRFFYAE